MNDTLKLLQPFIIESSDDITLETLAGIYKVQPHTRALATGFYKLFRLICKIKDEYWGLDETDVASWSLEILDKCFHTYDGTAKFITYYAKCLRNKLREETEKKNYKKRKCILVSINEVVEEGICDVYNLIDMLLPETLTYKEKLYCLLASKGYDNSFIADILGVSRMTISNIRKSLKVKLATLQNE